MEHVIKRIHCTSPRHKERAFMADGRNWSDNLGMYTGPEHPPVMCNRCAFYDGVTRDPVVATAEVQAIVQSMLEAAKALVG